MNLSSSIKFYQSASPSSQGVQYKGMVIKREQSMYLRIIWSLLETYEF